MTTNDKNPKIYLIAAVGLRGELGKGLDIPWMGKTSEDMKFFQSKTKEIGTVVMGYNTYLSLPKRLKDRNCLVLTTRPHLVDREGFQPTGSFQEAIDEAKNKGTGLAIIGGASIYSQALSIDIVDEVYLNHILHTFDGCDIFFPMQLLASGDKFKTLSIEKKEGEHDMLFTHLIRDRS